MVSPEGEIIPGSVTMKNHPKEKERGWTGVAVTTNLFVCRGPSKIWY
jgi:hypothetical protein